MLRGFLAPRYRKTIACEGGSGSVAGPAVAALLILPPTALVSKGFYAHHVKQRREEQQQERGR
jgi:hypothetical protein